MSEFDSLFDKRTLQQVPTRLADVRRASKVRLKRARRRQRWFVRGVLIGAAWAVLFTPEPGWEARQKVERLLRQVYQQGEMALTWLKKQQQPSSTTSAARPWPDSETLTSAAGRSRAGKKLTESAENGNW